MVFMVCYGFGPRCNSGHCISICDVVRDALPYNNPNSIEGVSDTVKNTIFKWIRTSPIRLSGERAGLLSHCLDLSFLIFSVIMTWIIIKTKSSQF